MRNYLLLCIFGILFLRFFNLSGIIIVFVLVVFIFGVLGFFGKFFRTTSLTFYSFNNFVIVFVCSMYFFLFNGKFFWFKNFYIICK